MNFWTKTAGIILRNRYLVLIIIAGITTLLASQTKYIKFSYSEANLLPENHQANLEYNKFLENIYYPIIDHWGRGEYP